MIYNVGPLLGKLIRGFDLLSLGSVIMAFLLIGRATLRRPVSPMALIGSLFIALAVVVNNRGFCAVPIGCLRPFSVLFGFLLMLSLPGALKRREIWLAWSSISLVVSRVMAQFFYTEFIRAAGRNRGLF